MEPSAERAAFIRQSMRDSWRQRTRTYAETAARHTTEYARMLLHKVRLRPGERVLDVATGPGTVALLAAAQVGPSGQVLATDLAPEWREIVEERCAAAGLANVTFRAMSADALDLPDKSFDVALCQFGLMFVPDPVQALRELRRVLRPGGRLGIVVWSTADRVLHFSVIDRHLAAILPVPPPEQRLPSPLSLGEPGHVERLAAAAGWRQVRVERETLDWVVPDPETMWRERVERGQPAVQEAVARLSPARRAALHDAIVADLARYMRDDAVHLPSEAIYLLASR